MSWIVTFKKSQPRMNLTQNSVKIVIILCILGHTTYFHLSHMINPLTERLIRFPKLL